MAAVDHLLHEITLVDALLDAFGRTDDPQRLAMLADALSVAQDRRAIFPLLRRLNDRAVQRDASVEASFCAALASFAVMDRTAAGHYRFLPKHRLAADVVAAMTDLDTRIPLRYLIVTDDQPAPSSPCRHGKHGECPYCHEHS